MFQATKLRRVGDGTFHAYEPEIFTFERDFLAYVEATLEGGFEVHVYWPRTADDHALLAKIEELGAVFRT